MMDKVAVVGDVLMDLIIFMDKLHITSGSYSVNDYYFLPGGSSANYATALARLGIITFFIGKIGGDEFGRRLVDEFKKDGVNLDYAVIDAESKSSLALILIDKQMKRASLTYWKTYSSLKLEELDLSFLDQVKMLSISGYSFISNPMRSVTIQLIKLAKKSGKKIFLDPCPCLPRHGLNLLKKTLKYIDIITPNRNELVMLTNTKNLRASLIQLQRAGPKLVVAKLGSKGCIVNDEGKIMVVPPFDVKVVETGGAGDAFCAGLTMGLLRGLSSFEAATVANAMGALATTKVGSRTALPSLKELRDFLEARKNILGIENILAKLG